MPEWLYAVEPTGQNSEPCKLVFACDCAVIEFRGAYWIMPYKLDRPPVTALGGRNATILAASQDVVTPLRVWTVHVTAPKRAQS